MKHKYRVDSNKKSDHLKKLQILKAGGCLRNITAKGGQCESDPLAAIHFHPKNHLFRENIYKKSFLQNRFKKSKKYTFWGNFWSKIQDFIFRTNTNFGSFVMPKNTVFATQNITGVDFWEKATFFRQKIKG